MPLSTKILTFTLLFFTKLALACSPAAPTMDANGRPVYPPEPKFRYEFVGVVLSEAAATAPPRWNSPPTEIRALRVRVLRSTTAELPEGSEHTLYRADIGADCLFEARSLFLTEFPVNTKVAVKTNDLVSGLIRHAEQR